MSARASRRRGGPPKYDPHLKRAIVDKMRKGMSSAAVETMYGIPCETAYSWKRVFEAEEEGCLIGR